MALLIKEMLSPRKEERDAARGIRFIGSISKRFFHVLPQAVLCLKDSSETPVEQSYREQLYAQAHLLRCLSSLYHKSFLCRDTDDQGLFFAGLLYHKLVCLCKLDCSFNSYNACKTLPYMCLIHRDRFCPDPVIAQHISFGPGVTGNTQGIESLNKNCKSRMKTWTCGRTGFLRSFMSSFYECIVGQFDVLGKGHNASGFLQRARECTAGIHNGFRFPQYDPQNSNMCYTCRRKNCSDLVILKEKAITVLGEGSLFETLPQYMQFLDECKKDLPRCAPLSTKFFFSKYLLIDAEYPICLYCFEMFQLLTN
jgi:hypothetical protein